MINMILNNVEKLDKNKPFVEYIEFSIYYANTTQLVKVYVNREITYKNLEQVKKRLTDKFGGIGYFYIYTKYKV